MHTLRCRIGFMFNLISLTNLYPYVCVLLRFTWCYSTAVLISFCNDIILGFYVCIRLSYCDFHPRERLPYRTYQKKRQSKYCEVK